MNKPINLIHILEDNAHIRIKMEIISTMIILMDASLHNRLYRDLYDIFNNNLNAKLSYNYLHQIREDLLLK